MSEVHQFRGHAVEVRRKAFRRHLGLSIYPSGRIVVAVNKTCSWNEIKKFLQQKQDWLQETLSEVDSIKERYPQRKFQSGEFYPYLGRDYELEIQKNQKVGIFFRENKLIFTSPYEEESFTALQRQDFFRKLKENYKETAKKLICSRVKIYSQKMNLFPNKVSFRSQRSIWGSCSAQNNLSFNWKLIVAPLSVIDYVVVHELAHIKHKNHSTRFWALVEKTLPDIAPSKQWLKTHHYAADFLMKRSEIWDEF